MRSPIDLPPSYSSSDLELDNKPDILLSPPADLRVEDEYELSLSGPLPEGVMLEEATDDLYDPLMEPPRLGVILADEPAEKVSPSVVSQPEDDAPLKVSDNEDVAGKQVPGQPPSDGEPPLPPTGGGDMPGEDDDDDREADDRSSLPSDAPSGEDKAPGDTPPVIRAEEAVREQVENESTYDHIVVAPASYEAQLDKREVVERFELDHTVKTAPRLPEQVGDTTRTNEVVSVTHTRAIGPLVSLPDFVPRRQTFTEQEVIDKTNEFLETVIAREDVFGPVHTEFAKSLHENLTFIGEKEYQEATAGIAEYWKSVLDEGECQQVLVLGDKVAHTQGGLTKSGEYLVEGALSHFTDEEARAYHGKLIVDPSQIATNDARDLKVVLLDDWVISGAQLSSAVRVFNRDYPEFASSAEMHLIAANEPRITRGFTRMGQSDQAPTELPIPVRAYFTAHYALGAQKTKAHITGAHSSVDHDFELRLQDIVEKAYRSPGLSQEERAIFAYMPPMANIVPPYRREEIELTQKRRFR